MKKESHVTTTRVEQLDSGPGYLLVGHNEKGEVVVNLDHDRTGHVIFSPAEARILSRILLDKATLASQVKRDAKRGGKEVIENVQPVPR